MIGTIRSLIYQRISGKSNTLLEFSSRSQTTTDLYNVLTLTKTRCACTKATYLYYLYFKRVTPITMKTILSSGPLKTKLIIINYNNHDKPIYK